MTGPYQFAPLEGYSHWLPEEATGRGRAIAARPSRKIPGVTGEAPRESRLIPGINGATFYAPWRNALWAGFSAGPPGDGGGPPSRGKAALFQILGNYASPGRLAGGAEGNVVYSLSNPYLSMR